MSNNIIIFGYGIAFLMAFTSMLIELSNKYGSYFQFTLKSLYSYLYCGAYGLVGLVGYWLFQNGINPMDTAQPEIGNQILKTLVTAMVIGWSAKGLLDAPILPSANSEGENTEGFRFRILINFLFLDANNQFDNIIARKQNSYFTKSIGDFKTNHSGSSDIKLEFEKKVYDYLEVHPKYGAGDTNEIAQFNTFMTQLVKEEDIDSSFRFAYRNLGYGIFKALPLSK